MNNKYHFNLITIFVAAVYLILILPLYASSDGYYIEEETSSTLTGNTVSGIRKIYYCKENAVITEPFTSERFIFDFNGKKVYLINDVKKTISTLPIENTYINLPGDLFGDLKIDSTRLIIKESGNKKMKDNKELFEVAAYVPRIGLMAHVWITTDNDPGKTTMLKFFNSTSNIFYYKIGKFLQEKRKDDKTHFLYEGETLLLRPDVPDKYFRSKVRKIESITLPDNVFEIPQDYTRVNIQSK